MTFPEVPIDVIVDDLVDLWHDTEALHPVDLCEFLQLRPDEHTPFARDAVLPERLHSYWRWLHRVSWPKREDSNLHSPGSSALPGSRLPQGDRKSALTAGRSHVPLNSETAAYRSGEDGPTRYQRLCAEHGNCTCPVGILGKCDPRQTGCRLCVHLPDHLSCPTTWAEGYPELSPAPVLLRCTTCNALSTHPSRPLFRDVDLCLRCARNKENQ